MSVWTALAVVLAVAVCGLAAPAVEDARSTSAERSVEGDLGRLPRAMQAVESDDAVPLGDRGARRVVTLTIPAASPTSAGVEFVAVGGVPGRRHPKDARGDVLAYGVADGRTRVRHVPFDVRVATRDGDWRVHSDARPLVVWRSGRTRITLRLVRYRGRLTVLVSRDGR
ncbi:DUF7311 family protein [Halomicrococcus sp. NG-SE-24]|uniref:DUF7311 family protein n=1 Tax=Halomicrococcus sp. NG-SE-24 TaxID=3436928 RepID=UPI003D97A3BB